MSAILLKVSAKNMPKDQGPMSGFRDFLASQTIARNKVIDAVTDVYERYGFMPIKTPSLERYETLGGKYGEEGSRLMYDFEDKGKRHLALRYDHTVPLARVMSQYGQALPMPYKRYVVGDVWRAESPQAGRYREFTQIDADIIGTASRLADSEVLAMMSDVFKQLNIKVAICVNDRRLLDALARDCGVTDKFEKFTGSIDKVSKIGLSKVVDEISEHHGKDAAAKVKTYLEIDGNGLDKLDKVLALVGGEDAQAAADDLRQIFNNLEVAGYRDQISFDQTIARGLDYYTSTIFETFVDGQRELGSIDSGGRYDNLIEQLGGRPSPAIGTSIGLDRLIEVMTRLELLNDSLTKTRAYIVNLSEELSQENFKLAQSLRSAGIAVELYYEPTKLGKQLAAIDKLGVTQVIIYGTNEQQKGVVIIRDLKASEQHEVPLDQLISLLAGQQ